MTSLEDVPQSVYRVIVLGIASYFGLLVVAAIAPGPEGAVANLLAQTLFGVIAIGIGVLLYARSTRVSPLPMIASTALVLGGFAQFFWIATGEQLFDVLALVLAFGGFAIYLVLVWTDG